MKRIKLPLIWNYIRVFQGLEPSFLPAEEKLLEPRGLNNIQRFSKRFLNAIDFQSLTLCRTKNRVRPIKHAKLAKISEHFRRDLNMRSEIIFVFKPNIMAKYLYEDPLNFNQSCNYT